MFLGDNGERQPRRHVAPKAAHPCVWTTTKLETFPRFLGRARRHRPKRGRRNRWVVLPAFLLAALLAFLLAFLRVVLPLHRLRSWLPVFPVSVRPAPSLVALPALA